MQELFYHLFSTLSYKNAYKKAIIEKDINIDKISKIIENLKTTKNGKKYYLYNGKFDIVQDLQDNYYKILNKIKKEFEEIDKIKSEDVEERAKNYLTGIIDRSELKGVAIDTLYQNICFNYLVQELQLNEEETEQLKNKYNKIIKELETQYKYTIKMEKENQKAIIKQNRENAKIKRRDKLVFLYLINKILK